MLWIVVIVLVSVVLLGLLEEFLEELPEPTRDIGYGKWEGGHLFSAFPEGWFCTEEVVKANRKVSNIIVAASLFMLLALLWFLVNVPALFKIVVTYLFLFMVVMIITLDEFQNPVKTWATARPRSIGIYGMKGDMIAGILGGVFFVLLSNVLQAYGFQIWAVRSLMKGPNLFMTIFLVGFSIPMIEEYFFNKMLATFTENYGVVAGVLGVSVIAWMFFHYSVYGLTSLMALVVVLFGIYRGMSVMITKSYMPSTIAHMFVNMGAMFPIIMKAMGI